MKTVATILLSFLIPLCCLGQITNTDVLYLKAERKYGQAKYVESKKMLLDYISSSNGVMDEHFMPYFYLGLCYYLEENYDSSLICFKKDLEYDECRSLYNVSAVYAIKQDKVNALAYLAKDQASYCSYPKATILNDPDWKFLLDDTEFKRIMSTELRPSFKKFTDSCDYYVNNNDLDMALKMMEEAINSEPENVQGHHGKGSVYMLKKEYQNALYAFQKENDIESASSYTKVKRYLGYQQKGAALSYMKDMKGAVHNTKMAIKGNKTMYIGYIELAVYQIGENQLQEANTSMLDYMRIADDDDFGVYITALTFQRLGNNAKASEYAQIAIDLATAAGNPIPQEYLDMRGK